MFKRTAVPPVGSSEHHARRPLNMALGFSSDKNVRKLIGKAAGFFRFVVGLFLAYLWNAFVWARLLDQHRWYAGVPKSPALGRRPAGSQSARS